jgi:diacylglycerol O-acyltransferase
MSGDDDETGRSLSAFDTFLFRGDADPRTRSIVGVAYVLEKPPARGRFVETFDRASRLITRLRQHVVAPPSPLLLPSWIVDPDFDLSNHLRHAKLPSPGDMRALLEFAQSEITRPLDPSRPLWEAVLVDGLSGGRAAIFLRLSHAISDGVGAMKLFTALFDEQPNADRGPMPPAPIPEDLTPEEAQREALKRAPWELARAAVEVTRGLLSVAQRAVTAPGMTAVQALDYVGSVRRVLASPAEPSPLLRARSLDRQCAAFELKLADLKRAGKAADATVNDVYLAGVIGALRLYHDELGESVEALPLAIPVNLRRGDEPAAGNHFGAVQFAAPVSIVDPRERLQAISERIAAGRAEPAIAGPSLLFGAIARLPKSVLEPIADGTPRPDVQASNLPGPGGKIFLAGREVTGLWPFGPIPGVAAMFLMQSLAGTCYFGVTIDPAAVTKPAVFVRCIRDGFQEVLRLGGKSIRVPLPVVGRRSARMTE